MKLIKPSLIITHRNIIYMALTDPLVEPVLPVLLLVGIFLTTSIYSLKKGENPAIIEGKQTDAIVQYLTEH